MATTKKPKKPKKKTSKKKGSKKKSSAAKAPEEMTGAERMQLQVQQTATALIQKIQAGEVHGLIVVAIGNDAESDSLSLAGATPPQRVSYLLDLASHLNMTAAMRNLREANERAAAAAAVAES